MDPAAGRQGVRDLARDKFRSLPWTSVADFYVPSANTIEMPGLFDAGIQRKTPRSGFERDQRAW
jgi:hypothetical protein